MSLLQVCTVGEPRCVNIRRWHVVGSFAVTIRPCRQLLLTLHVINALDKVLELLGPLGYTELSLCGAQIAVSPCCQSTGLQWQDSEGEIAYVSMRDPALVLREWIRKL